MDNNGLDPRYWAPQQLAGPCYEKLMCSKEDALAHLSSPDCAVRLAAVSVCHSVWQCGDDFRLIEACRDIANSNAADSFRASAIDLLALLLAASKSIEISQFLANIIAKQSSSARVRTAAYQTLRVIQFGFADTSPDDFFKATFSQIKQYLQDHPGKFSEETVLANLIPPGSFPEGFWESVDEIDWKFVSQFTSEKVEEPKRGHSQVLTSGDFLSSQTPDC